MVEGNGRISRGVKRGGEFQIEVDGEPVAAFEGETIAAVLIAAGMKSFRWTEKRHEPRGLFCGMGLCFDCLMTVDGVPNIRTCVTNARPGMKVTAQHGRPEVTVDAAG